jgi:hypothetical protein
MFNILQEYTKIIFSGIFLSLLASCDLESNKQKKLTPILYDSFEQIYYAKYALDFPHTKSALNNCIEYKNKPCLEVYKQFKEGKNSILSLSDNKSLAATLDIIEKTCLSQTQAMENNICYGGLMSLYFYNSSEQDQKIFKRINKYPKAIKNIIFNNDFLWFHNRPKNSYWINYITTLDVDWAQDGQKQFVLNMLKRNINQIEGEPWVLR